MIGRASFEDEDDPRNSRLKRRVILDQGPGPVALPLLYYVYLGGVFPLCGILTVPW